MASVPVLPAPRGRWEAEQRVPISNRTGLGRAFKQLTVSLLPFYFPHLILPLPKFIPQLICTLLYRMCLSSKKIVSPLEEGRVKMNY